MPKRKPPPSKTRRGFRQRIVNVREPLERFLIVCEGSQTEPNYFLSFQVVSANVKVIGVGANTLSLAEETIRLSQGEDYDQIWCVFDRDSNPLQNFRSAFQLAEQ